MQYQQSNLTIGSIPFMRSEESPAGLRLHGVYRLPDGGEVVVGSGARGGPYFLYHPLVWKGAAWVVSMPVAYVIDRQGDVQRGRGESAGWRVEDLADTGDTLPRRGW
jgi:hypothetical protein